MCAVREANGDSFSKGVGSHSEEVMSSQTHRMGRSQPG